MEHKGIARLLIAAGLLAAAGILFVFYLSTPLRILWLSDGTTHNIPWAYMIFKAICGFPYLPALGCYFGICLRIGEDRSFCRENVQDMNRITRLLMASAVIWGLALIAQLAGWMEFLPRETGFPLYAILCADALAMMASLAVALVAKMMAHLVNRAVVLQEDSDLTI